MEAVEEFQLFGVVALAYAVKDLHDFLEVDQVVVVTIHQSEESLAERQARLLSLTPRRYCLELKVMIEKKDAQFVPLLI